MTVSFLNSRFVVDGGCASTAGCGTCGGAGVNAVLGGALNGASCGVTLMGGGGPDGGAGLSTMLAGAGGYGAALIVIFCVTLPGVKKFMSDVAKCFACSIPTPLTCGGNWCDDPGVNGSSQGLACGVC